MPRPPWSGQYESLYEPLGDDFCQSIVTDGEDMLTWLRNQVSSQLNHGDAPDSSVIELCILALAGDPDFCRFAVERIARDGGRSADVDVNLLDARDRWKLARACSQAIRNGEVTPEPPRLVQQPKSSGVGFRTISMFALHDRVIQKSLTKVAECILDPQLPAELIGSRRGGSRRATPACSCGWADVPAEGRPEKCLRQRAACETWSGAQAMASVAVVRAAPGVTARGAANQGNPARARCQSPPAECVYGSDDTAEVAG